MFWIDTHAHLYADEFDTDRKEMVERALRDGVNTLLLPNIDMESVDPMLQLVKDFPNNCFPMMGLHPGYVKTDWEEQLKGMKPYFQSHKMVAVGEIGMDLYWDKTFVEEQKIAFQTQINWAKEFHLPIVIHAREAFDEIFAILDETIDERLTGVFHCFTGNIEQAQKIMSYPNFYMGIGGVVTYKKAALEDVLIHVPVEKIMLETDAPYLPPVPFRGKRNESAYLVYSAQRVAEIYQMKLGDLAQITSENAKKLFQI